MVNSVGGEDRVGQRTGLVPAPTGPAPTMLASAAFPPTPILLGASVRPSGRCQPSHLGLELFPALPVFRNRRFGVGVDVVERAIVNAGPDYALTEALTAGDVGRRRRPRLAYHPGDRPATSGTEHQAIAVGFSGTAGAHSARGATFQSEQKVRWYGISNRALLPGHRDSER